MLLPELKDEVPYIDFSPLQNALSLLQKSADNLYIKWNQKLTFSKDVAVFNKALYKAEQQLLLTNGLPRRNWYKHTIYAPGFYTGYGVKTMPGIREALEQRNWKEAQEQVEITSGVVNALAGYLTKLNL